MVRLGRLVQRGDGQDALGVGGRIGTTDQKAGLVDDVVPGLGPEGRGEPARRVVTQHEGRRAEHGVPRHPVPVGRPLEGLVDRRRGADEHVTLEGAPLDAVGERDRPHGCVVERVPGGPGRPVRSAVGAGPATNRRTARRPGPRPGARRWRARGPPGRRRPAASDTAAAAVIHRRRQAPDAAREHGLDMPTR